MTMGHRKDKAYGRESVACRRLPARTCQALFTQWPGVISDDFSRVCAASTSALWFVVLCALAPVAFAAVDGFDGSVISESGNYVIEYQTDPSPIPTNRMFEMTVSVRQRLKKSPARNVTLEVDAGMSEHNHGMNTAPVVERLPSR